MASGKRLFTLGTPFEVKFGFARAVRKANFVFVSGTTALKLPEEAERDGGSQVHHPDNAEKQAKIAMRRCVDAVESLGGRREDVTRVRLFVANPADADKIGAAYKAEFVDMCTEGGAGSANTMITGVGFVDPDILVEVEVDAIL